MNISKKVGLLEVREEKENNNHNKEKEKGERYDKTELVIHRNLGLEKENRNNSVLPIQDLDYANKECEI